MGTRGYQGRNSKADANQPEIVKALRDAGATVAIIEQPLDLLVGYMGVDVQIEVKNPNGKRKKCVLNEEQQKHVENWYGRIPQVVSSVDEALAVLRNISEERYRTLSAVKTLKKAFS